jgi:hypothetical protein
MAKEFLYGIDNRLSSLCSISLFSLFVMYNSTKVIFGFIEFLRNQLLEPSHLMHSFIPQNK